MYLRGRMYKVHWVSIGDGQGSSSPFLRNRMRRSNLQYVMGTTRQGKRNKYTIRGTDTVVRAKDCVLLRRTDAIKPIIARVEKFEQDNMNRMRVYVRKYYRPEETIEGRVCFHGDKELFLSNHYDVHSADTIEGKCFVHNLKNYMKLEVVGANDYYSRFWYNAFTGAMTPERVEVLCKCEMPYNPDRLMVLCGSCNERYHPKCVGMPFEEAMKSEDFRFVCSKCSPDLKD
ncbi:chromatin remodeling protein EBS isoform X1 [Medicago truncatula]|uniref:chromatin remodeling protein EBS isoform X1 n=1 Tax=Medicago truncatula TaxID=3880 RepID=UPI001967FDBC|nr:chromatin remodeling protein EBS isoform X1 [Medicago truncatula]